MLASKKTRRGVIGAVVLAGVLAVSGYALTDVLGYTGPPHAGQSVNVATETLTATNVHYDLDTTDPTKIKYVEFDLDHALTPPTTYTNPLVYVNLAGGTPSWYSCVITGTTTGSNAAATTTHPVCDTTAASTNGTALTPTAVVGFQAVAAD